MRTGRQALVRVVGWGSREQVVVLDAVMMSKIWEESTGEKAVGGGGKGGWSGRCGVVGVEGEERLLAAAVRELFIWENLLFKAERREPQMLEEVMVGRMDVASGRGW